MRSLGPGRRVGERALLDQDLDRELDVGHREHRALGRPGGARGVDQRGQVVGPLARPAPRPRRRGAARGARGRGRGSPSQEMQLVVVVAVPDPARLEVDDPLEVGALVEHRERLVDLLLVLGDEHLGARVAEQVADLGRAGWSGRGRPTPPAPPARPVGEQPLGAVLGVDRDPVARLRRRGRAARGRPAGPAPSTSPRSTPARCRGPCRAGRPRPGRCGRVVPDPGHRAASLRRHRLAEVGADDVGVALHLVRRAGGDRWCRSRRTITRSARSITRPMSCSTMTIGMSSSSRMSRM